MVRRIGLAAEAEEADGVRVTIPGAHALTRGLALLDIDADARRPLRLSDIVERAGLANDTLTLIAAPEADRPGNRSNDGPCDRRGRFWAGTLALDTSPSAGSLYRLDPDVPVSTMETGVHGLPETAFAG